MDSDLWQLFASIVVAALLWVIIMAACFRKGPFADGHSSHAYRDRSYEEDDAAPSSEEKRVTQLVTSVYLGARVTACRRISAGEDEWYYLPGDHPIAYVCVFERDTHAQCVAVDPKGTFRNMKREWQFAVSTQEGVQRVMAPILPRDLARAYLEIAVPGYLNHAREA